MAIVLASFLSYVVVALFVAFCLALIAAGAFFCRKYFVGKTKGASGGGATGVELRPGQSSTTGQTKVANDVIAWAFSHPDRGVEEWAEVLSRALTQQAARNESQEDFQLRVQKITNFTSTPPQLSKLSTQHLVSEKSLIVRAEVLWKRFELTLSLTPRRAVREALYSIDCHVIVFEFLATVEGVLASADSGTVLTVKFPTEPTMRIEVKQNQEVDIDSVKIERLVRSTISGTEFRFPLATKNRSASVGTAQPERSFELFQDKTQAVGLSAANELLGVPPDRSRKLLVKVVKANGLVTSQEKDYGSHQPFCVASMDSPAQRYVTSSVKNTANPFFDEQFVFDLDQTTKKLTFELHDKDRPENDDFLGMAFLTVDEFSRSRHVLPLCGKGPMTFGALTVEVTNVDSSEVPLIMATSHNVQHIVPPASSPVVLVSEAEAFTTLPSLETPTRTEEDTISRDTRSPSRYVTLPPKGDAKKKSFVGAIKKRFQRRKTTTGGSRSQSADRAQEKGQRPLGEGIYLTPPPSRTSASADFGDLPLDAGTGSRSRSNSLRSGIRRLFRIRRRHDDSPTRLSGSGFDHSPEGSVVGPPSPRPSPRLGGSNRQMSSSPSGGITTTTSTTYSPSGITTSSTSEQLLR